MRGSNRWGAAAVLMLGGLGCMRTINVGDELGVGGRPSAGGYVGYGGYSSGGARTYGGFLGSGGWFGAGGGFSAGGGFGAGGWLGSGGRLGGVGGSFGGSQPQDTCVGTGTFDARTDHLFNMVYSSDGSLVATATDSGTPSLRVFRVSDNTLLWEADAHYETTYGVAFSPDGSVLASAGFLNTNVSQPNPGGVKLWRVSDGTFIRDVPLASYFQALSVEFSHDGSLLATSGTSGVEVVRVSDFSPVFSLPDYAYSVHFSPDDTLLAADGASVARVLRVADGSLVSTMVGHTYYVQDAVFSPDGTQLATCAEDNTTRIWDVATGKQLQLIQQDTGAVKYVNDVIWYDSNRLITNDWQGGLHTWVRGADGKFQAECAQWVGASQALALSPDRSELRVGGSDSPAGMCCGHSGMWIFHGLFP